MLSAQAAGSKVQVGWVGLGNRGGKHIRTMMNVSRDDATIKAICDTFAPRLAKTKDDVISDQGTAPETYDDYYKMLADPQIDAIFIMTPEHLHRDMALAALDAGKHVYCEKPLSHTIEEGFEIVKAAEASGKKFQVGTQRRSSRLYAKAREIYESGVLGKVVYARAFWYRNSPLTFRRGAITSRRMRSRVTRTTPSSSARPARHRSTSSAISSGGCTGITRGASPRICWYTRQMPST